MSKSQTPRVKLTLNKYLSTWDGKVLRYLHDSHPGRKDSATVVMDLASAAWLPFAMRFFGATDAESKEAALYSARILLSQACSIVSEFGLSSVAMQGVVVEASDARIEAINGRSEPKFNSIGGNTKCASDVNTNNEVSSTNDLNDEGNGEEEEEEEQYSDDDFVEMWDFPELDAGFRT